MEADKYTKADPGQIRKLYWVARQAGMDNELLHARCEAVTGQAHISQLTIAQCAQLIDSILGKKQGYQPRPDTRPVNRASQEQINNILGIARKMGWLPKGDKTRINAFLRERYSVERLDWLTPEQAIKVTEALKAMLAGGRTERKTRRQKYE